MENKSTVTAEMLDNRPICPVCGRELRVLIDTVITTYSRIGSRTGLGKGMPVVDVDSVPVKCRVISHECAITKED